MGFLNGLSNGLSAAGAAVSQFAGAAGLEQQKADLAQQSLTLADQLQGARETAGRTQAGDIAAKAASAQQTFEAGQNTAQRATQLQIAQTGASATLGAAGISAAASKYASDIQSKDVYDQIAAAQPEQAARILAQNQQTALAAVQTQNATALSDAHTALEAETAKATPDPAKIASLKNQVTSLETSASTEAATTQAVAAMYRTDMDAVQHFNTQLVTATAKLNDPEMSDTDRAAQRGLVADLQKQLAGAQRALAYSSDMAHGRAGTATGITPTPPASAPTPPRDRPPITNFYAPPPNPSARPRVAAPATSAPPPTVNSMNNGTGLSP